MISFMIFVTQVLPTHVLHTRVVYTGVGTELLDSFFVTNANFIRAVEFDVVDN